MPIGPKARLLFWGDFFLRPVEHFLVQSFVCTEAYIIHMLVGIEYGLYLGLVPSIHQDLGGLMLSYFFKKIVLIVQCDDYKFGIWKYNIIFKYVNQTGNFQTIQNAN